MGTANDREFKPPEQDHASMRAASMRPVSGPASTTTLAAGGGLELPGREARDASPSPPATAHEPIPGERDPTNLVRREPGAMGGQFSGADLPPGSIATSVDQPTARDRTREGGGL